MSMTTDEAILFTRSLIKEPTAVFWTDTEISLYLATAMQSVWAKYSNFLYESKKSWDEISLTSGNADYDVPAGCFKISKITVVETGNKLKYIYDDELFRFVDASPPDATDYLRVHFLPTYTDITSFPDVLQPIVCVEAIIFAKAKDEGVGQDILDMRAWYEAAALPYVTLHNLAEPQVFVDFTEEETFSWEYMWTYKAGKIHLFESQNA